MAVWEMSAGENIRKNQARSDFVLHPSKISLPPGTGQSQE